MVEDLSLGKLCEDSKLLLFQKLHTFRGTVGSIGFSNYADIPSEIELHVSKGDGQMMI